MFKKKKQVKFNHFRASVYPACALLAHSNYITSDLQNVPLSPQWRHIQRTTPKKGS